MSLTRGLMLIAAFATTWGLLAGCLAAFWRLATNSSQGIFIPLASTGIALIGTLGIFDIIDRFLIREREEESVSTEKSNSIEAPEIIYTPLKHWAKLTTCLSIACGFFGILPLWAPPAFVIGILLAVPGLAWALAHKQKASYILPACGFATNMLALSMWPSVVGFFPTETGYELKFGSRSRSTDYFECTTILYIEFPSTDRDRLELLIDGKINKRWEDTTHRKDGSRLEPHAVIPQGTHEVTIRWNGTTIYSEIIQIPQLNHRSNFKEVYLWITLKSQNKVIIDGPRILED